MKIAFITTFYRDEEIKQIDRLKKEILTYHFQNVKWYVSDCRQDNRGYSAGINKGINQAMKDKVDIFVICNPDISIKDIPKNDFFIPLRYFDIWGFSQKQNGATYYGGELDKWRMSGGLVTKKPKQQFVERGFVSGSFICIKRNVIENIGLWDESYFLYYDEVDFCHRASKAGFKVGIDSFHSYVHFEVSNKVNKQKDYFLAKSRLMFLFRYGTMKQKLYELFRSPKTFIEEYKTIISFITNSRFMINFFSMNASSLGSKLFNFLNFLFLVRYLTAPEYGIYTLVWAQVTLLSPLVDLGTTSYGVVYLSKDKEKSLQSLFSFRLFLSFIVFIMTIILSLLIFNGSVKMNLYILITASVIFTNMFSGSYFILTAIKNKHYLSSRNSIIFNFLLVLSIITSLFIFKRLLAVFIVIFIGYNTYSLINFVLIWKEIGNIIPKIQIKEWFNIVKKSYVFVLISFFAGLYFKLDLFLLRMLKGETEVGIYSAGYKFFEALLFLASSYNLTATPVLATISNNYHALKHKVFRDGVFLFILGSLVALTVAYFAPYGLHIIFKQNFNSSISVLQIVIFTIPFILISSILMNLLYVLHKAHFVIYVFLLQTIINFSLNYFFIPKYSYFASSWITVISEIINCMVLFFITRFVWKKHFIEIKS